MDREETKAAAPEPPEVIEVDSREVACDGGPLGHPRVFLNMGNRDYVECPYCDRRFVLRKEAAAGSS